MLLVLLVIGPRRSQIADISDAYITPAGAAFRLQSLGKTRKSLESANQKHIPHSVVSWQRRCPLQVHLKSTWGSFNWEATGPFLGTLLQTFPVEETSRRKKYETSKG